MYESKAPIEALDVPFLPLSQETIAARLLGQLLTAHQAAIGGVCCVTRRCLNVRRHERAVVDNARSEEILLGRVQDTMDEVVAGGWDGLLWLEDNVSVQQRRAKQAKSPEPKASTTQDSATLAPLLHDAQAPSGTNIISYLLLYIAWQTIHDRTNGSIDVASP